MNNRFAFAAASLAVLSTFACALDQRPDLNSFLNKKVSSVGDLVTQVKRDPVVMDRFQRHYAMSADEVIDYLGSLHSSRLSKSGTYTVYSVPEGGYVKEHVEKLKAGTPVFVDVSGNPVMIIKCGNPLNRGPKRPEAIALRPPTTDFHPVPRDVGPDFPVAPVEDNVAVATPATPELPPLAEQPVAPPVVEGHVRGGGFTAWPLLFIPLVFIHNDHHKHEDHQPVPEPATMLVLGAGCLYIARKAKNRR